MVADTEKYLLVQIDSTFCKVHQHATGARKIFGNQAIGISRGGKNTKIHALVTENFQLIGLILSGGDIRDFILSQKAQVCIPDKSHSLIKHDFNRELYKARNVVKRFFLRIKNHRHIATRYDKLAFCFLNFVLLASAVIHF